MAEIKSLNKLFKCYINVYSGLLHAGIHCEIVASFNTNLMLTYLVSKIFDLFTTWVIKITFQGYVALF